MSSALDDLLRRKPDVPAAHGRFLRTAIARLADDDRLVAVAAGGSFSCGTMDEYSDLDLVIAIEPEAVAAVMADRLRLAAALGPLLTAFTGEHVGEPRLLICLFGPPLLHVDLKFVSLDDANERVEEPTLLWQRDNRFTAALTQRDAEYPCPDLQWIEDRFWIWLHYGTDKVGRGELIEAHDFLAFLRGQVLGPLALQVHGARPTGVRRVETDAPGCLPQLVRTLGAHDRRGCIEALFAAVQLYRQLRTQLASDELELRTDAERATVGYLDELRTADPLACGAPPSPHAAIGPE